MKILISFVAGLLFALGLGISGMTDTTVVKGFLDIFGDWNFNLLGVMAGAILLHSIVYHFVMKKSSPLFDSQFYLPTNKSIDWKLIVGAIIFGLGWGWAGICPGPGIVSLASARMEIFIFIGSMVVGMYLFMLLQKKMD